MLGLFLAGDAVFGSLAIGSIIVVAVAVLGSLTVLPALLMLLGGASTGPACRCCGAGRCRIANPRLWPALLRPSLTRPGRTLVDLGARARCCSPLPALGLKLASDSAEVAADLDRREADPRPAERGLPQTTRRSRRSWSRRRPAQAAAGDATRCTRWPSGWRTTRAYVGRAHGARVGRRHGAGARGRRTVRRGVGRRRAPVSRELRRPLVPRAVARHPGRALGGRRRDGEQPRRRPARCPTGCRG